MIFTHIRIALGSLRANRVRTALTTLGIVIGVASIALVLSLGEGARQAVGDQVSELGDNIILIKPGNSGFRDISAYNPYNTSITSTLTERDYTSVSEADHIQSVAPLMLISGSVRNGDTETNDAPIIATNESLDDILGLTLQSGEFIGSATSRGTVVIGQQLALELFGTDQARGQEIIIKGRPHTVIGVIKNTKHPINLAGVDLDHAVYTSLDNGKSFNQGIAQIQQIIVRADNTPQLTPLAGKIDSILIGNHENERDFNVLAGRDVARSADSFFTSVVIITALVSSVAIIVGGIGIMNIMLVSVSERTREIGIRKAVGATNGQIIAQFMIETLTMCLSGGLVGLLLAYGIAFLVGSFLFFAPAVNWEIIVGSLALAVVVGIIFGIYPAVKAARKDPIEALRQYQ